MPKTDKRIDTYITKSADFAKPILNHIRKLVHEACPDVEETIKWGFPHFDYKGIMCSAAAFKQHCAFNFWKARLLDDRDKYLELDERTAMGSFGRIQSLKDLPPDRAFIGLIKQAAKLNEEGVKLPSKPKAKSNQELIVPEYFLKALSKNKKAEKTFDEFRNSHRKEYVQWITEAKTEETRNRRIEQAIEMMSEGKSRNWKYEAKMKKK